LHLNAGYSKQWSTIPGSPSVQFITLDNRSKRVGLGINLYSDKAGLLKRTRVVASYAYHLPLNAKNDQLHFGMSLGALSERLNTEDINGDALDISAQRFNERDAVLDGDFGISYTTSKLTLQGAIPNIKYFLKKEQYNTVNWNTFFTAISYKISLDSTKNAMVIEPKLSYRGVRGYDDIIDGGINLSFASNKFNLTGIYHSTNSISFGFGLNFKDLSVLTVYTSGTSALKGYSNGNFEIGIGYNFTKKK
jgi:type IX secretion system PorP/SprF family membrane protein